MALVRTPSSARQPPVRRTSRNSYSHRVGAIAPTSVMQLSKPSWRLMMHASSAVRTRGIAHGRALPVHQLLDAEQIAGLHAHRRTMIEPIDQRMAWTDFGFDELLDAPLNQPDIRPLANTAPKEPQYLLLGEMPRTATDRVLRTSRPCSRAPCSAGAMARSVRGA